MGLKIFWSQLAEDKLEDIFNYYKIKAGIKVAKEIVYGIVDQTIDLNKNPKIGQLEDLLKNRPEEFRYLIYTNYKIIYRINQEENRVVIANTFDTRQYPQKIEDEAKL